jgi:hypothetical protein
LGNALNAVLCLAGDPGRCETIRPAEWPAQVSLLECGVFGQHFASDRLRLNPSYIACARGAAKRASGHERESTFPRARMRGGSGAAGAELRCSDQRRQRAGEVCGWRLEGRT